MSSHQNVRDSWGPPTKSDFVQGSANYKRLQRYPLGSIGFSSIDIGERNTLVEFFEFGTNKDSDKYYSMLRKDLSTTLTTLSHPPRGEGIGWKYRIYYNTDANNKQAGNVVLVERQVTGGGNPYREWEVVTDEETLKKLENLPEVQKMYKEALTAAYNDETNPKKQLALMASGNDAIVNGEISLEDISWIKSDPKQVEGDFETRNTVDSITPKKLTENYKTLFKEDMNLKYPIDMFTGDNENEGSQDYIYIEQFTYKPPQAKPPIRSKDIDDTVKVKMQIDKGDVNRAFREGIGSNSRKKDLQGTCILPIPNKLGISNGVSWGEARANAIEFSAFNAASNSVKEVANNPFNIFGETKKLIQQGSAILNTTMSELKRGQSNEANAGSIVNAVVAKALLSRLNINVDVDQFITRQTGAAINPNLELLFSGPQLRTFSFQFDFAPNSKEEAKEVRMIQRWFREGMLPLKNNISTNGATLFLGSPNVFRICYKNNKRRIRGLNTFKICALTSCEIDFTPDGVYQSYEDKGKDGKFGAISQPVRTQMALTFNELTPIFRNDYSSVFNDKGEFDDPTLEDVKENITGDDKFTEDDLGF